MYLALSKSMFCALYQALLDPYFKTIAKTEKEPSAQPISKLEFEFERRKITKVEIRELIYREILEYHPNMLKEYFDGPQPTSLKNLRYILYKCLASYSRLYAKVTMYFHFFVYYIQPIFLSFIILYFENFIKLQQYHPFAIQFYCYNQVEFRRYIELFKQKEMNL